MTTNAEDYVFMKAPKSWPFGCASFLGFGATKMQDTDIQTFCGGDRSKNTIDVDGKAFVVLHCGDKMEHGVPSKVDADGFCSRQQYCKKSSDGSTCTLQQPNPSLAPTCSLSADKNICILSKPSASTPSSTPSST